MDNHRDKLINDFINCIDTKLYSRLRSSKSDAECRRYLKEHLKTEIFSSHKRDNSWLSPLDSERKWQENQIKNIWKEYPNCNNWQILNGLIVFSCKYLNIDVKDDYYLK